jgi:4-amino-4-deoxy-L-arabinose transferase-like glycosyltransferase
MGVRPRLLVYGLLLIASFAIWMIAIRAPLWLDETVSMYLIQGGLKGMASRHVWPDSPTYSCLLWLWTKVMGRGEILLRVSSLLPMLGAVYLLYRAARELFDREAALFAAIVFSLHSIIIFAAIDIRPYAFAALATNASILALVRLRHDTSNWMAAGFGFAAACIVQFQLLFAVILPALLVCFVAARRDNLRALSRQLAVALPVFAVACLPAIPRLLYMAHTSGTHVFAENPTLLELGSTLTLRGGSFILVGAAVLAATKGRLNLRIEDDGWTILLCLSLALVPILVLYGLSVGTTVHVFVPRYRLVAVPGIALCWAWLFSRMSSEPLRILACAAMIAATAYIHLTTPFLRQHQYSWKYAIDFMEKNASADGAPVLMCSDIPEADYMPMPRGAAILDSGILPPLSYYPLTVPVTPLPRALNDEARRDGEEFLQHQAARRQRFLATAFVQSFATLDWLAKAGAGRFAVRPLGQFDGVRVWEFTPQAPAS